MRAGRARARANIALAKYWGKSDRALNLPAVPSVSVTLEPLTTETSVSFEEGLKEDLFVLDGAPARPKELGRVRALLDGIRARAELGLFARVESTNAFPTAAGLASSASGFAALAAAASEAAGLSLPEAELSAIARQASASAARSVFGGYVLLPRGEPGDRALAARPIAPASHWDLRVIVALTAAGRKPLGSRDAMAHTAARSAYYPAWVERSLFLAKEVEEALLTRDRERLGPAVEESFLAMHASAIAAGILYWKPASLAALERVRGLREEEGLWVYPTMDAGPHVKALCEPADAPRVKAALEATEGVIEVIEARPGPGIELLPPKARADEGSAEP